ncbi:GNAT family N-acetyltransferase [Brevibacillus borstelensis]|uniref:GNAT family N-acetyltransferase n=1 Tax=Brevibacillus borstelensis TaxID=45462 RepID=UPI0030C1EF67
MSANRVRLYEKADLAELPWERLKDGEYARAFLEPLILDSVAAYISNVQTRMGALVIDDLVLPVTVNDEEYDNSYVCSPYTHYISYAREEIKLVASPLLASLGGPLLSGAGAIMRLSRVNRIVFVNNWLLSTNLYHPLTAEQIGEITRFLTRRFPRHIVAFRSVSPAVCPEVCAGLERAGYGLVPSRFVYLFDPKQAGQKGWRVRNTLKRDRDMMKKSGCRILRHEELGDEHAERIVELYQALYVDKYSHLNPQLTPAFVRLALHRRILTLIGLEREGRLDGILGYFHRNGMMTTPLFGYDTALPKKLGLYRMLSSLLVSEAESRGLLLHQSAGVGAFKADRGAEGTAEFTAVYVRHLPGWRQLIWKALAAVLDRVVIDMARKYKW